MKRLLTLGWIALIFTSCDKDKDGDHWVNPPPPDPEVFFQTGNGPSFRFDDFDFYDSSTCIFYFKTLHEELNGDEMDSFASLENGDTIYSGTFWPPYMSSIPFGPFISSMLSFWGNYAFKIENWWHEGTSDPRNGPEMIRVLKDHDLLHAGLAITIDTATLVSDTLNFTFTVSNADETDLLIMDIDKMGPALFHYFTNGLYLHDAEHQEVFTCTIEHQAPDPWNSWETGWLTKLMSGESKTFTIRYPVNAPLTRGKYWATFEFSGLSHQVSIDQLYQGDARVWLGEILSIREIEL